LVIDRVAVMGERLAIQLSQDAALRKVEAGDRDGSLERGGSVGAAARGDDHRDCGEGRQQPGRSELAVHVNPLLAGGWLTRIQPDRHPDSSTSKLTATAVETRPR